MNEETFWKPLIEKRDGPNSVRVKGTHYQIGPERPATPRQRRGFRRRSLRDPLQ